VNDLEPFVERQANSTELVILLHALLNRSDRLSDVREVIRNEFPHADMYAPELGVKNLWCRTAAEDIVADVTEAIDRLYAARALTEPYQSITFVGHSIGAVFARKIAIIAHGEQRNDSGEVPAPFESALAAFRDQRVWARSIRRIVLLAGMNRGWSTDSGESWFASQMLGAGQAVGELLGGKFTIFAIRRGAPFLVQTRLQWLALMNPDYGGRPPMTIVQLLGSVDDLVSPDDSIDFAIDGINNIGEVSTYNYLEVRHSGHSDIVQMAESGPAKTAIARAERRTKFMCAFAASPEELSRRRINRAQMEDTLPPPPDAAVENMVFVVHGIRDKGFWTKKIARTIKAEAEAGGKRFESWTEGYGYFAMLPFLLRSVRQRKVEWLMDRYCEARARYPNAVFHYVGHSNGTYLAARALLDYPAARFSHIVFAGSVVRRKYDWSTLIKEKRVDKVLNYVATFDWVVAIFPKGVQLLSIFDLGSAGHDGFDDTAVVDVNYIRGRHGAGHEEGAWNDIARFIVHGAPPTISFPPFRKRQNILLRALGRVSGILLLGGLALLIMTLKFLIVKAVGADTPSAAAPYILAAIAFIAAVRIFITRF
jgi:pimeloyl-ACP methyl ester carboxylesterase